MIYQEISKNKVIKDLQEKSFSKTAAEIIYIYMCNHYEVKHYDVNVLAKKFLVITAEQIKNHWSYGRDIKNYCKENNYDFSTLEDIDVFTIFEDLTNFKIVERLNEKEVIFDKEYYHSNSESY
jgi:hypothetical protein